MWTADSPLPVFDRPTSEHCFCACSAGAYSEPHVLFTRTWITCRPLLDGLQVLHAINACPEQDVGRANHWLPTVHSTNPSVLNTGAVAEVRGFLLMRIAQGRDSNAAHCAFQIHVRQCNRKCRRRPRLTHVTTPGVLSWHLLGRRYTTFASMCCFAPRDHQPLHLMAGNTMHLIAAHL